MNGDWMLIVLEALAGEIETMRYRMKLFEDDNERLRIENARLRAGNKEA